MYIKFNKPLNIDTTGSRIKSIRISKQSKYRDKQAKGFSIKLYKKLCLVLNQFEIWYFWYNNL